MKSHVYCKYCTTGTSDQLGSPSLVSRISTNVSTNEKEKMKATLSLLRGNQSKSTTIKNCVRPRTNTLTLTIWRNKLSETLDDNTLNNNVSASQCDLSTNETADVSKYHVTKVGKSGKRIPVLHKTPSCPDGLKYPNVCLESAL